LQKGLPCLASHLSLFFNMAVDMARAPVDEVEAKRLRKAAKRAAKEVAAAQDDAAEIETPVKKAKTKTLAEDVEVDSVDAKAQRKAAKKAAKEAVAAQEVAEEKDQEAEKAARKAAKKAAKAAAEAVVAVAEEEEQVDAAEERAKRKAAKKAAKIAAAAAEAEVTKKDDQEAEHESEEPTLKKAKIEKCDVEKSMEAEQPVLKVFIKGLPYSLDEASLKRDFGDCGEIVSLQFPLNEEGRPKGFAFISFATKEGFEAALKFDNTDYGGRQISVAKANENGKGKDGKGGFRDWECPSCGDNVFARNSVCRSCGTARPDGPVVSGGAKQDQENTVFIRGLPFSVTEDSVRKDFSECGEIESLKLPLNEEGKPRGIAFIKYKSAEGVDAAIKFNDTEYGGRYIGVEKAGEGKGKGKDGKGKGKDSKGKGKDGKDGKDGKGKGKKGKGKAKGKATSEAKAKNLGSIVEATGEKKTFDDSDDE